MTTVAYRDGILASDSQVTDAGMRSSQKKIWRLKGCAIAVTGDVYPAMRFVEWYKTQQDTPNIEGDFECIIAKPGGILISMDGNLTPLRLKLMKGGFFAFGSGRDYAIGAMRMGADAKTAVRIACEYDCNSGGRVQFAEI